MLTLIAINVVLGFTMSNVAWQAHLGGAIVGGIAAGLLYAVRRRSTAIQLGLLGGLAALLFAAAYVSFAMADLSWIQIVR